MNKVYSRKNGGEPPAKKHLEENQAALGVGLNSTASHVSLIYPDYGDDGETRTLKQLHFMSDRIMSQNLSLAKDEKGQLFYAEAACIDEENLGGFNAYLMAVARNDVKMRYGVDWTDYQGIFDGSGKFCPPENAFGLTCASFIAEVFYGYSLKLFHMPTWRRDDVEDINWRNNLCQSRLDDLNVRNRGSLSREQIQVIADTTPLVRLRPPQVAAAVATLAPESPEGWDEDGAGRLAVELMANFREAAKAANTV